MANVTNASVVTFGTNSSAQQTITHFGLGFGSSGATTLYASAALDASRDIATGATPKFDPGDLDVNLTTTSSEFESAFLVDMLELYFNNTAHADIGDASGLQPAATEGSIYVSLHTANPAGGNQSTSEATYTGYARVAVGRNSGAWTVS